MLLLNETAGIRVPNSHHSVGRYNPQNWFYFGATMLGIVGISSGGLGTRYQVRCRQASRASRRWRNSQNSKTQQII
jgi:hypothetical protein